MDAAAACDAAAAAPTSLLQTYSGRSDLDAGIFMMEYELEGERFLLGHSWSVWAGVGGSMRSVCWCVYGCQIMWGLERLAPPHPTTPPPPFPLCRPALQPGGAV